MGSFPTTDFELRFLGSGNCPPCWGAGPLPGAEPALLRLAHPSGTPQNPIFFLALERHGPCPGVCLPLHPGREGGGGPSSHVTLGSPSVEEQKALSCLKALGHRDMEEPSLCPFSLLRPEPCTPTALLPRVPCPPGQAFASLSPVFPRKQGFQISPDLMPFLRAPLLCASLNGVSFRLTLNPVFQILPGQEADSAVSVLGGLGLGGP